MSDVRQRFSIIPAMAVTDPRLEPRDLQVLCLLGRHTNDLGWCCRSQVRMARELACGRATVQRAILRLVEAGYVEHRAKRRDSGGDAAHDYRVVIDPPAPADDAKTDDGGVPTGGQGCPPKDGQGVPTHERAPRLTTPVKREERGARDSEPDEGKPDPGDADDRRALEKRVKQLASRLSWPKWDRSSTEWTVSQFAALSPDERQRAEERGPAYIAQCGKRALSLGVYFRERKFDDLPDAVLKTAAMTDQRLRGAPFGKVWSALRLWRLLQPHGPLPKPTAFLQSFMDRDDATGRRERLAHQARHGWPAVNQMHDFAAKGAGITLTAEQSWLQPIAAGFEKVRVGSDLWLAWKQWHAEAGWPWLPDPGGHEWVYFPAGGPAGLEAFERAVREEADDGA